MCKVYGYCRISRKTQNIERQVRNIREAYPEAVIFQEAFTGTKSKGREKFERLCKMVKAGDTIVFDSVSRMSRNADEGFAQYMEFYRRGVELIFLKEPSINTASYRAELEATSNRMTAVDTGDDATDSLVSGIMEAVSAFMVRLAERQIRAEFAQAQKEVDDLHQRTSEGIETARINGKQIGQIKGVKLTTKKSVENKEIILKHSRDFNGTLTDVELMQLTGLARGTYYKYKRELKGD